MTRIQPDKDSIKIDVKDKKILVLLSDDSRMPISEMSKKVRLSRDTVAYRIKRLQDLGAIIQTNPVVNFNKLGYTTFHVFLLIEEKDKLKQKELISTIKDHDNTISLIEYSDDWDLEWRLIAKDLDDFEKVTSDLFTKFSSIIMERAKFVALDSFRSILFPYHFYKKTHKKTVPMIDNGKIDNKDRDILKLLSKDARASTYDIAKQVSLSADAIGLRIKKLLSSNMIKQFSLVPCYSSLGYDWYTFVIRMKTLDKKTELKFKTFVEDHPYIVRAVKTLGSWDILCYIIADSHRALHQTIKQIKSEFAYSISSYSTLVAYKEHVFNPFPKMLEK